MTHALFARRVTQWSALLGSVLLPLSLPALAAPTESAQANAPATPALMLAEGFTVEYADVGHRPRRHGQSKYTNLGRLLAALWDLLGVIWLKARRRNPRGVDEL